MAHCLVTDQHEETLIDNERNYWLSEEGIRSSEGKLSNLPGGHSLSQDFNT